MKRKRSAGEMIFDNLNTLFMLLVFIIMSYPFIYVLSYSLSDSSMVPTGLIIFPVKFTLNAYKGVMTAPTIANAVLISVLRTILGSILLIFVTAMAGYCLTREDMKGVRFFRKYFVFTMYVSAGLIPNFLVIKAMNLLGSFWVYIIPTAVSVFSMVLIKTFIESIPKSLEESAIIDGANDFHLFWKIIFPVSIPVIAAVTLFSAVGQWNSFIDTQFYNTMNPELYTLQYVLYQTLSAASRVLDPNDFGEMRNITPKSFRMAMTIITVLPIAVVYPILQKYFIGGIMIGSIKG
ncbi:MAG: carbohydrate ABC transporter permease [Ruminiclostridium sp.]|nr:carbohydrate ABC transporter permease [Ruminiclostridium sp.]